MARRRTKSGGGVIGFLIIAIIALLASIPKEVWIGIAVIAAVVFIVWAFTRQGRSTASPTLRITDVPRSPGGRAASHLDIPIRVSSPGTNLDLPRRIPAPLAGELTRAKWLAAGEAFELAGLRVTGGMVYVGMNLVAANGRQEPALINPNLRVAREHVDVSARRTQYWPSYSEIDPEARRAYLQWLASGRRDPAADIGYVFLFFYGLERRALVDLRPESTSATTEMEAIRQEVRELLGIYKNSSFQSYGTSFLSFICATSLADQDLANPPDEPRSNELPFGLKVGLARFAASKKPVPSNWALKWALVDPLVYCRTPVQRCRAEFEKIFPAEYKKTYGDGILLPVNKTKLKITYRPASAGLAGACPSVNIGDLPDVSAITGPQKKLQNVVDACTAQLEKYSRHIGKNEEKRQSLEAAMLLPVCLWPESLLRALEETKNEVEHGESVAVWGGLLGRFGCAATLPRGACTLLQSKLEEFGIGLEPDFLGGAKTPGSDDPIVLFACQERDEKAITSGAYSAASLIVDLGAMMAGADGNVAEHEFNLLKNTINSWTQLDDHCRGRLVARLQLQITKPSSFAGLKKRLDMLSLDARRTVADVMVSVARADEAISPDEVKLLEKTYKLLQLDPKLVYSDLHGSLPSEAKGTAFAIDAGRVRKLQEETADISAVLREVFADESESFVDAPAPPEPATDNSLLGLDPEHSNFARLLISRPQWSRSELEDAASDMQLMLDGALEQINEAALDTFDLPLTEGDDPVDVNREISEKVFA